MDADNPYSPSQTADPPRPSTNTRTKRLAVLLLIIQVFLWLFAIRSAGIILWHVLRPLDLAVM